MIRKLAISVLVALVLFMAGSYLLPRQVRVERSIEIGRPVITVFTVLNSFESFPAWSPWHRKDPAMQYHRSGPRAGVGARLEWSGDPRRVGRGWQEITLSEPNSRVEMHLVLEEQGAADTRFHVERIAGGARVRWVFETDLVEGHGLFGAVVSRYFGLLFDRWIGQDFETGLASLKAQLESLPAADFSGLEVELLEAQSMDVLYIPGDRFDPLHHPAEGLALAYGEISAFMARHGIELTAQPMAVTRRDDQGRYRVDAAIPARAGDVTPSGRVLRGRSPSGPAVRVVHRGAYDGLSASYEKLAAWMAAHGYREGPVSWEHYISDPTETAEEDRVTFIYVGLETAE